MKLSEDRISHLSHLIWDKLYNDDLADYPNEDKALLGIKQAIAKFVHVDQEIDQKVRQKIQSLSRKIAEGSDEWSTLYRQYYEEEAVRRAY
ncbi:MAG: DUF507 family protein [Deltaproteobacteria bacterium]|nr:DUF507 family protein [Deltaproteobacteria bacterium]